MAEPDSEKSLAAGPGRLSEDWLAVILAFLLILLSTLGLFGEQGLKIVF